MLSTATAHRSSCGCARCGATTAPIDRLAAEALQGLALMGQAESGGAVPSTSIGLVGSVAWGSPALLAANGDPVAAEAALATAARLDHRFPALYMLLLAGRPVYVGAVFGARSSVHRRLRSHLRAARRKEVLGRRFGDLQRLLALLHANGVAPGGARRPLSICAARVGSGGTFSGYRVDRKVLHAIELLVANRELAGRPAETVAYDPNTWTFEAEPVAGIPS